MIRKGLNSRSRQKANEYCSEVLIHDNGTIKSQQGYSTQRAWFTKKTDGVASLVADPSPANFTTDTDTHPSECGDHMVNLVFGCRYNRSSFNTRQS